MDNGPDNYRVRKFEETEAPNISYTVTNNIFPGSEVIVQPKHKGGKSYHPLQDHPTVFYNVGLAIVRPDKWCLTDSATPETKKQLEKGQVIIYEKDNFFEQLDAPGFDLYPDFTIKVVTLYKYDGTENPTLTYWFDKKASL